MNTVAELLAAADAWRDQWVGVERNPSPDEAAAWLSAGARLVPRLAHALRLAHPELLRELEAEPESPITRDDITDAELASIIAARLATP